MVRRWRYAAMEDPGLVAWWTRTWPLLVGVAVVTTAYMAWVRFQVGGDHVTRGVDDLGDVAAAAVAVAMAGRRALRASASQERWGWALVAAFSAALGLGDAIYAYYDFILQVPVPFPSIADVSYLTGSALGLAAVLVLSARGWVSSGARSLLDGGIIAGALLFFAWVTVFQRVYEHGFESPPGFWIALSYPVAEVLMAVIVLSAISHCRDLGPDLYVLMAGLAVLAASDAAYSYLVVRGLYHGASLIDGGYVASYLLFAVAAASPARPRGVGRRVLARWQLALPYVPFIVAALVAVVAMAREPANRFAEILVSVVLGLVIVRQLAAVAEAHALNTGLDRTVSELEEALEGWKDAATEREIIIEKAPLGITRLDRGGRVMTTNLTLQQMLGYAREEFVGQPFWDFLHPDERELGPEYRDLASGRVDSIYIQSRFLRKDGSALWCSQTAMSLRDAQGRPEGFIAILKDVTERIQEAEHAGAIQRLLLPRSAPRIAGYELAGALLPAEQVAGDFYDWVVTDGHVDLTLADVMGKGVGPALLMAVLRTALHIRKPKLGPAARVQRAADTLELDGDDEEGLFVTLFQARLHPGSGLLNFVDAGHGYWAVRRPGGGLVRPGPRSLPLGIELDGRFEEGQVRLDPGDTLIVYS
ncbi:MAG: SpoIIE family protein phosphatase, partial [Candidatus Dormibacteraeota bacterium]|nr:SpoIIE family protein phosphatase [Candidatus Dormibacteraeota bacterium]